MCAGAGHVDMTVLKTAGFDSRKTARSAFFERARLLYDFDCAPDRISLIQSFLLMTYWYGGRETHKDRTFWIRMAVTIAQDLGLDMKLDYCETKRQRMLKRLWWCCFMRDQFMALMMWTPPQLGARHRYLPMLELSDFELQEGSAAATNGRHEWEFLYNSTSRTHLAILCIAKAKLCVCINQILQARYTTLRYENCDKMTTILVPTHSPSSPFEILELDRQLREWHYDISGNGGFDLRNPANTGALDAIDMHRAHLKLLFLSALIALHRPQALDATPSLSPTYRQLSRGKLHDAADEIAHIAISIKNLHLGTHLNPKGLNLLLPIMLAHLQDVQPLVEHRRHSRQEKYHDSMQMLDAIGDPGDSEVFLPAKLETSFVKFNILPSHEYKIPTSVDTQGTSYDSLRITPAGIVSTLSQLGTITQTELDMLAGMGADGKHKPHTTNSEDATRVSPTLTSSATTLVSQCSMELTAKDPTFMQINS
ncbi:putative C6 transcription factor (Ctf1B) [Cladophialophora carrionii]|uniref:Putative C6 transcription factor (Ctf1B) n=1 Tax=Cladophialophora carrionii TaxID=86049 RepID=A0A1C1CSY4_9EURO|nr:putative C6 transcription factor (Ctf1B) [Cladophialophora carrionii]